MNRDHQIRRAFGALARQPLFAALIIVLLGAPAAPAAPAPAEQRAFEAAGRAFHDGFYDRAERELADFVGKHPQSDLLPDAVLLWAQARIQLKQFESAAALLTSYQVSAGRLLDQYRFWLGECQFQLGEIAAAADTFARLAADFPKSSRRFESAYREALARFTQKEYPRAAALLTNAGAVFVQESLKAPNHEFAVRGQLLLAEALIAQKQFKPAEQRLQALAGRTLPPDLAWQRQYWLTRAQFEDGRPQQALESVRQLGALATNTASRVHLAESMSLQGAIYQQLNQYDLAIQSHERNLAEGTPPDRQRTAHLKIIELAIAQNNITQAVARLEGFLQRYPQDPAHDLTRLTLGELRLKEYFAAREAVPAGSAPATNLLALAGAQFERVIADFPQSPLIGKAWLNRGLILWEEGKFAESQAAFTAAALHLPVSDDQAIARFKLADAQFRQKDYAGAISNYQFVVENYTALPRVKSTLFDQALYQIVRAAIETGDLPAASGALTKILAWYPDSFFSDRSLLLVGQALNRSGRPADARQTFVDFLRRFPASPLAAEAHLAIARTYVQEQDWVAAIGKLDDWVGRFGGHPARAQAEFDRAWVNYQAGRVNVALGLFTNFVTQFPSNALAPLAQNAVADHYLRAGDFPNAERNYQLVYQNTNWPPSELTWQARMMAGRAALARQGYKDASQYFTDLINALLADTNSPPDLLAEAWLKLGDAITEGSQFDAAKPLDSRWGEAIKAFTRITQMPTNRFTPLAWGRIGDCHFQLAKELPDRYTNAMAAYQIVMTSPLADVPTRSQAEWKLAGVLEKIAATRPPAEQPALFQTARDHYLNVVYGTNLREGERPDPFWVERAGLAAARLLESLQQWESAVQLYQRLHEQLAALRPSLEKRIERAREQAAAVRN
jgi:TolA-binding protein